MDTSSLTRVSDYQWRLEPHGKMRAPAVIFATEALISDMDDKVLEQAGNVAMLPGLVGASYAMPDAHWGYGWQMSSPRQSPPVLAAPVRYASMPGRWTTCWRTPRFAA